MLIQFNTADFGLSPSPDILLTDIKHARDPERVSGFVHIFCEFFIMTKYVPVKLLDLGDCEHLRKDFACAAVSNRLIFDDKLAHVIYSCIHALNDLSIDQYPSPYSQAFYYAVLKAALANKKLDEGEIIKPVRPILMLQEIIAIRHNLHDYFEVGPYGDEDDDKFRDDVKKGLFSVVPYQQYYLSFEDVEKLHKLLSFKPMYIN